ncbi:hypothetical protein NQ314_019748 [Rhamnusium bicolor]|uniref:PiggyBac transposable element-derived protein domain-containing protein n=1 Tax=Rhamnusium bicolor TaxID=1586634 RepID=A0AAV8WM02_9CUCU|nr:hypothetical protein NQ314_019748 [Rhamnusium bicolor]
MMYNSTKCRVDVVDELCVTYNIARSTRTWAMVIFHSVLNIAAINALVIYLFIANNSSSNIRRSQFLEELTLSLLDDYLQRRSTNQHLPRLIKVGIKKLLNLPNEDAPK